MPTEEQTYREGVKIQLDRMERKLDFTNGKLRKIIIALVLMGGIIIGQSTTNMHDVLSLFFHSLGV